MSFLPIVERELRTAARKSSTYRARGGFVLVTSLVAAGLIILGSHASARQVGNALFQGLATLAFAYCVIAGIRHSADCLSEEKREGTLGLLFLTDLRGYDIVLGKLVSVSVRTFQGLFAVFPLLAIGLVLGGMTSGEFWRIALVLTNTLFFALCVGLWVSALSRQSHIALAGTCGMLLLLISGPISTAWLLSKLRGVDAGLLAAPSPVAAAMAAWDMAYQAHPGRFWVALCVSHLLGWGFLLLASAGLPHSWEDRASPAAAEGGHQSDPDRQPKRAALRLKLLEINPIYWLAGRHERQRHWLWTFVGTALLVGVLVAGLSQFFAGHTLGLNSLLDVVTKLVLKLWVAWQACATLAEARRTGAVELLLATPLTIEQLIRGHWQALQRFFGWPVVASLLLGVIAALPAIGALAQQATGARSFFLLPLPGLALFGMATFVLDMIALAWVGMWMGLSQPKPIQAFSKTVLLVMILPALFFCFPNILFDLFWISWARRKLEHDFRQAAAEQFAGRAEGGQQGWWAPPVKVPPVIQSI